MVDLLILRSEEIDTQLEMDPENALGLIYNSLKCIRVAVHKLVAMVLMMDNCHGSCFVLNAPSQAGDVCEKPQGDWINLHERSLLGRGIADTANFVLPTERVGVRGDLNTWRAHEGWFHIVMACYIFTAEHPCRKQFYR